MNERIITSNECVAEGIAFLSNKDKHLKGMFKKVNSIPLRLRNPGFANLVSAIVSQQISVAAADAILRRMGPELLGSENKIINCNDEQLKQMGLSRQKISYVRSLAEARIDYNAFERMGSAEIVEKLTEVKGIGRWTAEIYLMFSLGRADIFAAGDLALQEGCRILYELPDRPNEKVMREIASNWKPWRAVAARGLWAFYSYHKNREGIR